MPGLILPGYPSVGFLRIVCWDAEYGCNSTLKPKGPPATSIFYTFFCSSVCSVRFGLGYIARSTREIDAPRIKVAHLPHVVECSPGFHKNNNPTRTDSEVKRTPVANVSSRQNKSTTRPNTHHQDQVRTFCVKDWERREIADLLLAVRWWRKKHGNNRWRYSR